MSSEQTDSTKMRLMLTLAPDGLARELSVRSSYIFPAENLEFFTYDWLHFRRGYAKLLGEEHIDLVSDMCCQTLLCKLIELEITHLLVPAWVPISAYFLRLFKQLRITLIHWFFEDMNVAKYWPGVIAEYNHFFSPQIQLDPHCPTHCQFHRLAHSSSYHPYSSTQLRSWNEREYDICFIGEPTNYRISALEHFLLLNPSATISLAILGEGWDHYQGILKDYVIKGSDCDRTDSRDLMEKSRIGLHLSHQTPSTNSILSHRIYDLIACGCNLLCERLEQNQWNFPDIKYFEFSSTSEIPELFYTLRTHPLTYETLLENQRLIWQHHTLQNRLQDILGNLNN